MPMSFIHLLSKNSAERRKKKLKKRSRKKRNRATRFMAGLIGTKNNVETGNNEGN